MTQFYKDAKPRMPSQKRRILALLEEAGDKGVNNLILNKISFRYADRIYQLKKEGYRIVTERISHEVANYRLVAGEKNVVDPRKAIQVIVDEVNDTYNGQVNGDQLYKILEDHELIVIRRANGLNRKN